MNFDAAFDRLIGHEGGYSNIPEDPGGETNFGISKRSYPDENIRDMTLNRARVIYRRDFWGPAGCDAVPDAVRFDLFDTAVNSGVTTAVRLLQRALGETEDGVLGPRTLRTAEGMSGPRLLARFNGARLLFMASLPTWPTFGKGWTRRVAKNLMAA